MFAILKKLMGMPTLAPVEKLYMFPFNTPSVLFIRQEPITISPGVYSFNHSAIRVPSLPVNCETEPSERKYLSPKTALIVFKETLVSS